MKKGRASRAVGPSPSQGGRGDSGGWRAGLIVQEVTARLTRAEIRQERGDVSGALDDAAKALTLAYEAKEPQWLRPALAFFIRLYVDLGRLPEARALADELVATHAPGALLMANFALAAAEVRRLREFRGAVEAAPTDAWTPWRSAVADGRFGDAADVAEERGFPDCLEGLDLQALLGAFAVCSPVSEHICCPLVAAASRAAAAP
jgi:hypothetical protein